MTRLRTCDSCSRHVFVTETHCPFCSAPLAPVQSALIFDLKAGMSRAQRFALVAAVASQTLAGCSKTHTDTGLGDGNQGPGTSQAGAAATGQAANSGGGLAGTASGRAGSSSDGNAGTAARPHYGAPVPIYGAPITPGDAGKPRTDSGLAADEDAGTATATDAGPPRAHPVYGAPIPIYSAPFPPKR
jgi:hypothetical protein